MKQIKRAGQSVRSGLSLMCIVCLLCGLLCGFFWLAFCNQFRRLLVE